MLSTNLKHQIERQIRFQSPEGFYHICTKESKRSAYFYVGTETQLDNYEEGKTFKDGELLKFRVSDHDAMCGNSWPHEEVILQINGVEGYSLDYENFTHDEKQIAIEIASIFCKYFDK